MPRVPFERTQGARFRTAVAGRAAGAVMGGLAFGFLAPFAVGTAAADAGANNTCVAEPAAYTPAGPSFVVDGSRYNIGYDTNWNVFEQSADPSHQSDFTGTRPSDHRHTSGHHGVDIFGPEGAPLVAPEDSVVLDLGSGGKGGNWVWLESPATGEAYYFAHLDAHAPGLQPGATLPAGAPIGVLGDTGNAAQTAPHLHFEVHPGGRGAPAVDPFPRLMEWRENEAWRALVGQVEADTVEAVCRIGEAWEAHDPALAGEEGRRRFFLDASDLRDIGARLELSEAAIDRLVDNLDVLGYANGAKNADAGTVSIIDLRAVASTFEKGERFDAAVALARAERDTIETRGAITTLVRALEDGDLRRDGDRVTFLGADDLRQAAARFDIPEDVVAKIEAHLGVLGRANGVENRIDETVSVFDLRAVHAELAAGQTLDDVARALA